MELIYYFLAAFGISLLGSLPFGVINLNILSTAVHKGVTAAIFMSFGAVLIEGIQLILVLFGYTYLVDHPDIERILRYLALPVFLILAGYYLFTTAHLKETSSARSTPFIQGALFALANVLVYPFWIFWLAWLDFPIAQRVMCVSFIMGGIIGAFAAMLVFILLGRLIATKADKITVYLNKIIGFIFLGLAIWEFSKYF